MNLPGGFLELFGKPARESACECERPARAEPRADPRDGQRPDRRRRHQAIRTTASTSSCSPRRTTAKVVDEIYLAVLNRLPTAKEREGGIARPEAAAGDHAEMLAEYKPKHDAFEAY